MLPQMLISIIVITQVDISAVHVHNVHTRLKVIEYCKLLANIVFD